MRSLLNRKGSSRRLFCVAAVCGIAGLLTGCNPPGKPAQQEAANQNPKQILDFKTLYTENCSGCHGSHGMNGPARILNDATYLAIIPRDTMRRILIYGRSGTAMPAWAISQGGPLTNQQIDALVNGIYTSWSNNPNLKSPAPGYQSTIDGDVTRGKQLFARDCLACHGKGAVVGPVTDPAYLSLSSNQLVRTSIIVGRRDLGMPNYVMLNMGHALTDQDVTDLVAYVTSFRPPGIDKQMGSVGPHNAGQQTGTTGSHENENGTGQSGSLTKGNEGSGTGPGSPHQQKREGNKGPGSSSQRGVK